MNISFRLWLLGVFMAGAMFVPTANGQDTSPQEDPWQWLEDVTGEKALDWVRARNKVSQAALESDPGFAKLKSDLLAILDSDARIPMVSKSGDYLYNFWRDKKNPRGLWRRTTMDEYVKAEPKWEILLDLDALGKAENENWVWGGGQLLRPDYKRAMLSLSRGGADAKVYREFDVEKKDRYERLLAYVYLKDGTFLNAEIVKQGYASLMTYPPNVKYADDFVKLYREARENNRGLWKE